MSPRLLRFLLPLFVFLVSSLSFTRREVLEAAPSIHNKSVISYEDVLRPEALSLDSRAVATFQKITTHNKGILPHLPIEIRLQRTGPIKQETSISANGVLTVTISFSCKASGLTVQDSSSQEIPCTTKKSFQLSDFSEGKRCRYEINRMMNSLVLHDGSTPCYIAFQTKADFDQAIKIFSILVNQSIALAPAQEDQTNRSSLSLQEIAQESGFTWIAVLPRHETFEEMLSLVNQPSSISKNGTIFWLTKKDPQVEAEKILLEANNISPIFLYPLSTLNESSFVTLPFVGAEEPALFSTPSQAQSVFSHDTTSLRSIGKSADILPIRMESYFPLTTPSIIISRGSDERALKRALKKKESSSALGQNSSHDGNHVDCSIVSITPQYYFEETPEGSTLKWLTGSAINSDDCLRALFFRKDKPLRETITHLYREYPFLKSIFQAKSRIRKGLSIQSSLFEGMKRKEDPSYKELITSLYGTDEISYQRAKLSFLLALEASLLYGDASSLGENGTQYSLILLEKLGAPWSHIISAETLLREITPHSPLLRESQGMSSQSEGFINSARPEYTSSQVKARTREVIAASSLIEEAKNANQAGVPLRDWLKVKAAFLVTLYQTEQFSSYAALRLHDLQKSIAQLPSGIKNCAIAPPLGNSSVYRGITARPLYSAYFWEKLDPIHRDGLSLKRMREKYEEHMIHHPSSEWKGRFWDWIDAKIESGHLKLQPGTRYLTAEERPDFQAIFDNGTLISPIEFAEADEIEAMFVIGLDGKMYIGQKKDAQDPSDLSFSHASFFAGLPVASSGKIVFRKGKPTLLTDHSGHYRPKRKEVIIVLKTMEKLGVDLNEFSILHSSSSTSKKLWKSGTDFLIEMSNPQKDIMLTP